MSIPQTQRALAAAETALTAATVRRAGAQQLAAALAAEFPDAALAARPLLAQLHQAETQAAAAATVALEAYRAARLGPPVEAPDAVETQRRGFAQMQGFAARYHGATPAAQAA